MDSTSLESSLFLAAGLVVFLYLSVVAFIPSRPDEARHPTADQLQHIAGAYRLIKYASLMAVAVSFQALLVSQAATALSTQAPATLGLVLFVVAIDRLSKAAATAFPNIVSTLHIPLQALLIKTLPRKKRSQAVLEPNETDGNHHRDVDVADIPEQSPMVITEEEQSKLDLRERSMIRSILKLDEASVRGVMVPRVDMVTVEVNTALPEVAGKMLEHGHSRLPVFEETLDHVVGIVYSRDLLRFLVERDEHSSLISIIRPAYFIPESKLLDDLLKELQEKHLQMAIVVDEYGGVEGLVTLEDLIEEIVGEIEDEFSRSMEPRVTPMSAGELVVDARLTLDYISDLLGTPINHDDVDTVGGLVYSSLGKMPEVGDQVTVGGLTIEVVSLFGRRINKLKLVRDTAHED